MQKLKPNEIIHLTDSVLRTLSQSRITTIQEFLQEDISKLATITKLSLPQILAVRNDIFAKYSAPVKCGLTLLQKIKTRSRFLCTGIERLNVVLGGGIPKSSITEICGLTDSGKTQLCFQVAINVVKISDKTVLYVDTKGDFSAVRIQKILDVSGFSHKEMAIIMCKIRVVRLWTLEEVIELFQNIKKRVIQMESLAAIIVDSLPCLMLQFLGDDNKIGLKLLNTFVNYSRYFATELEISLICVNIQSRWVDQDMVDLEDDGDQSTLSKELYIERRNRCLGKYWQQIPHLVLLLEKSPENSAKYTCDSQTVITVLRSSQMETISTQCTINISNKGVT